MNKDNIYNWLCEQLSKSDEVYQEGTLKAVAELLESTNFELPKKLPPLGKVFLAQYTEGGDYIPSSSARGFRLTSKGRLVATIDMAAVTVYLEFCDWRPFKKDEVWLEEEGDLQIEVIEDTEDTTLKESGVSDLQTVHALLTLKKQVGKYRRRCLEWEKWLSNVRQAYGGVIKYGVFSDCTIHWDNLKKTDPWPDFIETKDD
jgi:hypothetical protein